MSKPGRNERIRIAADIFDDDDMPDGAYFAMVADHANCDIEDIGPALAGESDERSDTRIKVTKAQRTIKCADCNKKFADAKALRQHRKARHK